MILLKKHLILLRSLEEAFSKNLVKFSDCRAFSLLCSEHLDADCFEYTMRLQNELLGSCPWKQNLNLRLFPRTLPANQRDLPALVVDALRKDNDKRFVRMQDVGTQTQWQETAEVYRKPKVTTCTDRADLCGKIVGIASGLSFRFQGHNPSSSF